MRKSIATAAAVTLAITLAATPIAAAGTRKAPVLTAAKQSQPTDDVKTVLRRIVRKLFPVGTNDTQDPVHPTIPIPK